MRARAWGIGAAVAVLAASVWYVQAPPRTAGDYRERAAMAAETLRSQVETARLWVRELEAGRATRRAAVVGFREAEADAEAAASEFAGFDPRGDTREIRSDLTALGAQVTDALGQLRIAAQDGRWNALPALAGPLPELARRLEAVGGRADP